MNKTRRSINLLTKEKILKEIDAGVDYSIIIIIIRAEKIGPEAFSS